MVATDPVIVNVNRAMFKSVHSVRAICHERRWLCETGGGGQRRAEAARQ